MATGLGIEEIKVADATETEPALYQGTTAQDMQIITASKYENAGILTGAKVFKRSDWKVNITRGGVVVDLGSDLAAEVPVHSQTMTLQPAPATGERIDTIYVHQSNTQTDNLARVVITDGAAPSNAVILDKLRVPAGATKSTQCVSVWNRRYARHSLSSQGAISSAVDTGGSVRVKGQTYKACAQEFFVDTDRKVNLKLSITAGRTNANGVSSIGTIAASMASLRYDLYIDNKLVRTFEVGIDRRWKTVQLESMHDVTMGAHTAHIVSRWEYDGDMTTNTNWVVRWGGPEKYSGDALTVFDAGVII